MGSPNQWMDQDIFVTASNPPPGRTSVIHNTYGGPSGTRSDDGLGINVYVAGGTGVSGAIPVAIVSGGSGGGGGDVNITSSIPLTVVDDFGLSLLGCSSTATLSASASFTGAWTDILNYSTLFVVVKSDRPSDVGGLKVQWSPDAVNVVCEYIQTYQSNPEAQQFYIPNRGKYVRIVYKNNGFAQSNFLLGAIARKSSQDTNQSEISYGNSTTTPLLADASFTGSTVDLQGYSSVAWSISSDKPSATDGVKPQFSPDGQNWTTRFAIDLRAERTGIDQATDIVVRPHDRFFRLVYQNGNQAQGWFRLQTMLNKFGPAGDGIGIDQAPKSGMDAMLVKALITGRSSAGGGTYIDVKVDPAGKILSTVDGLVSVTSSQAQPVYVTGSVIAEGMTFSGSISATPVEAYPNAIENVRYTRKAQRFDLNSDTTNYIGYAALGTSPASASWTIKRLSFDASGSLEIIEWSSTGSVWNNRASEVYS